MTSNACVDTDKEQVHYRYAGEIYGEAPTIVCSETARQAECRPGPSRQLDHL